MRKPVDRIFLFLVATLTIVGFVIFLSASLGLLAREGARFSAVAVNQFFFGIVLGGIALFITSRLPYKFWRKHAFYLFLGGIALMLLVFIPGLGLSHGGAKRWILLGPFSFQPSEIFKILFVIYFATWLSGIKNEIHSFKFGILPLMILLAVSGGLLLRQPDFGTFFSISLAALAMFVAAGASWKDLAITALLGLIAVTGLVMTKPYIMERVYTFLDPSRDPLGSGYQVQQSLIAIGSGGITGRGFGQSVQKFEYLPEPIGDSIFAVAAEEFGFIGSVILILLFVGLALRGLKIASNAPDSFSGLMTVGIITLIAAGSFMNIGSMLSIFPLTGDPLIFVSHGGTSLLFSLMASGIILNISRYGKA